MSDFVPVSTKRKFGGGPPPDDPRRCQRRSLKGYEHLSYEQRPLCCKNWALRGARFCKKHNANNMRGLKALGAMPLHYRVISKTLGARLADMEASSHDALSLRDELNIIRTTADEAVSLFSIAYEYKANCEAAYSEAAATGSESEIAPCRVKLEQARKLHDSAAAALQRAFKEVRDTALDAAKIEAMSAGKFSTATVKSILGQAALLLHEVCGDEHDAIAKEFEERLYSRIKLDVLESTGTLLTPDKDAIDMDNTVPL